MSFMWRGIRIEEIKLIKNKINNLKQKEEELLFLNKTIEEIKKELDNNIDELNILEGSFKQYNLIIKDKNDKYLNKIKLIINKALLYIFDDEIYEIDIETNDRKIEIFFIDKIKSIKKGLGRIGGGIRVVIATFLQIFFIQTRDYKKILFCDESLYDVSQEYREKFFEFLKKFCKENDFKIVVMSHDSTMRRFIEHIVEINN